MQNKRLYKKRFHFLSSIQKEAYSEKILERKKKIDTYKILQEDGICEEKIFSVLEVSQAIYYRWKKRYATYGLSSLDDESRRPQNLRKSYRSLQDIPSFFASGFVGQGYLENRKQSHRN